LAFLLSAVVGMGIGLLLLYARGDLLGASLGWGASFLVQGLIVYPVLARRYFGQPVLPGIARTYLPGLPVAFGVLLLALGLSTWMPPDSVPNVVAGIFICGVGGALAAMLVSRRSRSAAWQLLVAARSRA
jgi:hypothetical protein